MLERESRAQEIWLEQLGEASGVYNWTLSQFEAYLGSKILEIGCGIGTFTRLMGEGGAEVLGLDIDKDCVDTAMVATRDLDQVRIELSDVTTRNWDREFDTVVAVDVIEHIEDDNKMMNVLYQALTPGGRAIIKVPAMPAIYGTLDDAVGHYRRYSRKEIVTVMAKAGFQDVEVKFFNSFGILGWWLNGTLLRRRIPPNGQVKIFERLLPLVRALDRISPQNIGLSLVAVGSRPNP